MDRPNRFATIAPIPARLLLAGLALLIASGLLAVAKPEPAVSKPGQGDAALYRAIAADTRDGGGTPAAYYAAATAEQRARGYPLRPFVTVREPALALLSARLGDAVGVAFQILALAVAVAVALRLRIGAEAERWAAIAIAMPSVLLLGQLDAWHEAWSALLVALAIVIRADRSWWPACLVGLAALLLRELAAPMICALAATAWRERRPRETIGWLVVLLLFAAALALHAHMVASELHAGDPASPGWTRLGGWRFLLDAVRMSTVFSLLPPALTAILVPLAFLGWAARGDGLGDRAFLALTAFAAFAMIVGRPDNLYWGLMLAPLLPAGLAWAPRAIAELARAARQAADAPPCTPPWPADASS